ncbi:hypothetical protein D3C83_143630 [compost metagenome]
MLKSGGASCSPSFSFCSCSFWNSDCGNSIWIVAGSTPEGLSSMKVTSPGQAITIATMMSCSTTQGIAPQ